MEGGSSAWVQLAGWRGAPREKCGPHLCSAFSPVPAPWPQSLGDAWNWDLDSEEDELAWDAATTLRTIYTRDGNFFW